MSSYVPIDFEDGVTPLNAATFDHLEDRVELLDALKVPDPAGLDEKWLKVEGGAMLWVDPPAGGGGGGLDWEGAWAGATPYVKGDVVTHLGVTYGAVNDSTGETPPAAQAAPGALPVIPLVTTLPATPFDGQEVILVDSLTAPTYQWRLRYVVAKASNKWVYVGGTPRVVRADTLETVAIANVTFQDPYTVKPRITLDIAGIYGVEAGATLIPNSACTNLGGIAVGGVNPVLDGALVAGGYSPVGSARQNPQPEGTVTVTAGQVIELMVWHNQGGAMNMGRAAAYIKATPVAVGG